MNFQAIRTRLDALTEHATGGIDLAVYVHGKPVFRHSAGYQNIEENIPISEKTLYRMFSMTKIITCAAALQLWEQGKYLLTDPVADYLPEFANIQVRDSHSSHGVLPPKNTLRIQHLFSMSSGIDYNMETPALQELYRKTDDHFTTRQFAEAVAKNPLQFEPGSRYCYGLNHDVLGAIIEVITGQELDVYCKEHIFTPLAMNTACFKEAAIDHSRLCVRYRFDSASGKLVRSEQRNHLQVSDHFCSGGAGTTMTLDDYAKFACAMTNRGLSAEGVRILAPGTVDMMRANHLDKEALLSFRATDLNRKHCGYGLGVATVIDSCWDGLSGRGTFDWGGAWNTKVTMDPENGVTFLLCQQGDGSPWEAVHQLFNMAYAALAYEDLI